jgi:peptidoglycan/xylan/chitin deacetylase (PgdA/CDA1 family)
MNRRRLLAATAALLALVLVVVYLCGPYLPFGTQVTAHGSSTERNVALTFDDGPSATYTPQVLQILEQYNVVATFFVVGANVERHPEVARSIVDHGHQIANHSESHSNNLPYWTPNQILKDYRTTQKAIRDATGETPRFYRPPHKKVSPWMRWTLRRQGVVMVTGNCAVRDWTNPGVDKLISRSVSKTHSGSIILLHDGLDLEEDANRSQLVQALPAIIEKLQAEGYTFVTVAQLLNQQPYSSDTTDTSAQSGANS